MANNETIDIPNVEIFSVGYHQNERYDKADLDVIVDNFRILGSEVKPPVRLGHNSGLPAGGWVENVRRVGNKLIADLVAVPVAIAKVIKNRGFRRVSPEVYRNYQSSDGKRRGLTLSAVALLGGDIPAIKSLKDIAALYYDESGRQYSIVNILSRELAQYGYPLDGLELARDAENHTREHGTSYGEALLKLTSRSSLHDSGYPLRDEDMLSAAQTYMREHNTDFETALIEVYRA